MLCSYKGINSSGSSRIGGGANGGKDKSWPSYRRIAQMIGHHLSWRKV